MSAPLPLAPWTTALGAIATVAAVVLLHRGKRGPLGSGWACLVAGFVLAATLYAVTRAVAGVEALAGGQQILDTRYPYRPAEVLAFAAALGPDGRAAYAAFQLGRDTWAPPAFACFVGSVACASLPAGWARAALVPVWAYLVSVLLANALMPVVMLHYPALDTPLLQLLLYVTPWLDFAKYTLHLIAWAVIASGWIAHLVRRRREADSVRQ